MSQHLSLTWHLHRRAVQIISSELPLPPRIPNPDRFLDHVCESFVSAHAVRLRTAFTTPFATAGYQILTASSIHFPRGSALHSRGILLVPLGRAQHLQPSWLHAARHDSCCPSCIIGVRRRSSFAIFSPLCPVFGVHLGSCFYLACFQRVKGGKSG